ncbi:unnamed protein product [Mytilus edulis]|uniref:Uncharacterized protein n=1 Tax=Mytilus edulis TaxID=6550 RepID=A0A8S3QIU9_MYTED|nr:unnamed protein product [Mytilus edulis]
MANVFTKRTGKPRSTTLGDFCGPEKTASRLIPRAHSPTRLANPHPVGLFYQPISNQKKSYGIWHPNFQKIAVRIPSMKRHTKWVNFCNGRYSSPYSEKGKAPEIIYAEDTTSRVSYCPPSRFPELNKNQNTTRYGHSPNRGPVIGIIITRGPASKWSSICAFPAVLAAPMRTL